MPKGKREPQFDITKVKIVHILANGKVVDSIEGMRVDLSKL